MEFIGRLTKDAVTKTVKNDKTVVEFTAVENDSYKPKGGERVDIPTFFKCSYWLNEKIGEHLTKGTDVKLTGRVGMSLYNDMSSGEAKGSLTFHVNTIKIIHKAKPNVEKPQENNKPKGKDKVKAKEDLPF